MSVSGLTLFKDTIDIDFYTEQRVSGDNNEMVTPCFGNVYTNNVLSIVGINASGKTSLLKIISFVIDFMNGESINNISNVAILDDTQKVTITVYFFDPKEGIFKLESEIIRAGNDNLDNRYIINNECLLCKKISRAKSKKDLFKFDDKCIIKERDNNAELLDEFERNDGIYIVRNRNRISAQKLCKILARNDIKKNEAFKSDFLCGTVPTYDSYMQLKKSNCLR